MGGYDTLRGKTERVRVVNNTFLDNDQLRSDVGEVELNYRLFNSTVLNNVFRSHARGIMVTNGFRLNRGNLFDGNAWFAPGKDARRATWYWKTRRLRGFDAWRTATGGDASGRYADPLLTAGWPTRSRLVAHRCRRGHGPRRGDGSRRRSAPPGRGHRRRAFESAP
jgi:hypothetical protein